MTNRDRCGDELARALEALDVAVGTWQHERGARRAEYKEANSRTREWLELLVEINARRNG